MFRKDVLIDRSFRNFGQLLRTPDLRLGDVRTLMIRTKAPFSHTIDQPGRGVLVFVRRGKFRFAFDDAPDTTILAPAGTTVGFERARPSTWTADDQTGRVELFVSSIPQQLGILQQLQDGMIVVPAREQPFAGVIQRAVDLHLFEYEHADKAADDAIIRRCAEICLMQFVSYARSRLDDDSSLPTGLAHDENLLRAWGAYYADPKRRWTVQSLADAAGLSRTAFAERFRNVFGTPPLQTLTALRLEQAVNMLQQSKAPLIEIAFTVGYNSESAFVRAFHRHYRITPGKFRERFNGGL